MVDPKTRVIEYYRANVDEEIDKITKELKEKKKELDAIKKEFEDVIKDLTESLTLSAVKLTGLPSGTGISRPVEKVQEQLEQIKEKQNKIIDIYKLRLIKIENELTELFSKKDEFEEWLKQGDLSDIELNAIELKYKCGYTDWKVAQKIPCNTRTVWKILSRAFNKLKKISK